MKLTQLLPVLIIGFLVVGGVFVLSNRNMKSNNGESMNNEDSSSSNKPVDQSHRSYELELTAKVDSISPQNPTKISYKIKNDKGKVLKNYETVHEKIMHFIVVRRDLQNFQHIHPEFNKSSGEFAIDVSFPTDGPYRIFPDFTPADDNPQKLPVTVFADLNVGNIKNYKAQTVIADKQPNKIFGEYEVDYSLPVILEQQKEAQYNLMVNKDGQPVTNLDTYLGALGHSVILKSETLDFLHTHALGGIAQEVSGMDHGMEGVDDSRGPGIKFSTTFPSPGTYKIFTQFQHQGKVITTDYVVQVT